MACCTACALGHACTGSRGIAGRTGRTGIGYSMAAPLTLGRVNQTLGVAPSLSDFGSVGVLAGQVDDLFTTVTGKESLLADLPQADPPAAPDTQGAFWAIPKRTMPELPSAETLDDAGAKLDAAAQRANEGWYSFKSMFVDASVPIGRVNDAEKVFSDRFRAYLKRHAELSTLLEAGARDAAIGSQDVKAFHARAREMIARRDESNSEALRLSDQSKAAAQRGDEAEATRLYLAAKDAQSIGENAQMVGRICASNAGWIQEEIGAYIEAATPAVEAIRRVQSNLDLFSQEFAEMPAIQARVNANVGVNNERIAAKNLKLLDIASEIEKRNSQSLLQRLLGLDGGALPDLVSKGSTFIMVAIGALVVFTALSFIPKR